MAGDRRKQDNPPYPRPRKEGYFDDYYPHEPEPELEVPEFFDRDAYYAQRDEYYARRDEYYAQMEQRLAGRADEADTEEDEFYEDEPRRHRRSRRAEREEEAVPRTIRRKEAKRRGRRGGRAFRTLLTLALAAVLILLLTGTPPVRSSGGAAREAGHSTILLVGLDPDTNAADTILLLSLEQSTRSARLLFLPGEIWDPGYTVPWLRSAYSHAGGGRRGMEELLSQSARVLGFTPDAYLLTDLSCFSRAVDMLGGVDMDLAADVVCTDAALGVSLELPAGERHLSGEEAVSLLRYCTIYAESDAELSALRDQFLRSALLQWLRPGKWLKYSSVWRLLRDESTSDLSFRNWRWIVRVLSKADVGSLRLELLPGQAELYEGFPVYMPDAEAAAPLLQAFSPYE